MQNQEFEKRIKYMSKRLKADYDDLIDWYKNDVEDVVEMTGEALEKIIKEYLSIKFFYRKNQIEKIRRAG